MQFNHPPARSVQPLLRQSFSRFTGRSLPDGNLRVLWLVVFACLPLLTVGARAQEPSSSSSSSSSLQSSASEKPKSPALVDPAGPEISLQSSEALFDVAAALNACGYDQGLESSEPVRTAVREQMNEALAGSAEARDVRDRMCAYISQHRLSDASHDLAQYISLALYVSPPPKLEPSEQESDLPPDSTQVLDFLPILRSFAQLTDLHVIWVKSRPQYDEELARLHDPLTRMITDTNVYLKTPASSASGRRFVVVVEPMLGGQQANARVYGPDYVVVVSPQHGAIPMTDVRHTYLHYEVEPLLYARGTAIERLQPILKTVRDAPLEYTFRSDVVSLTVECMIRAIEARTMDTGVPAYKAPETVRRNEMEKVERERSAAQQRAEAVRQQAVHQSMVEGYVLTAYFYNALGAFEREPQSFKESIGEMVYGMDVNAQVSQAKNITFAAEGSSDLVRRTPRQLKGLDLAEMKLIKGDMEGASALAQQSLAEKSGDAARADFILARVAIMHRDAAAAQHAFAETIRLSKDPRMLAWSHIYLGRLYDVQDQRDEAVTEYRAALTVRDGQADTRRAAESGLKEPYAVPRQTHRAEPDDGSGDDPAPEKGASPPEKAAQTPPAAHPATGPTTGPAPEPVTPK